MLRHIALCLSATVMLGCTSTSASISAKAAKNTPLYVVEAATIRYPNQARNAVSLTFDDGRASQVLVGTPILDKYQAKATFYVMAGAVNLQLARWQHAVANGHEIGNHTTSHLCTGNFQWLRDKNAGLEQVDLTWLRNDIEQNNQALKTALGVTPTAFAYPCGNTFVGRGLKTQSYVPLIAEMFDSGRTWLDETGNNPGYTDFAQLTGIRMDGLSFDEIKTILEQLRGNQSWLILAGHDVGEKGLYSVDQQALARLIEYLQDPANGYWLDTVSNVAKHLRAERTQPE
ncbi:polysaccharide deacetylase family protein [Pseudoalteromonas fenneropenaei]|uniref:Polysaccharide deacetylase family protein n=1 Tax=Pseudoalteromonas fenneropenaei TaxID=1737459 RepID=A0ABV7CIQ3_9GAMM